MRFKKLSILVLLIIIGVQILSASQIHVKLDDPIYTYLDRMATQGWLPFYMNDTKPLTRDYIAEQLIKLNTVRTNLRRVDRQLLDEFMAEFRYELTNKKHFKLKDQTTYYPFSSFANLKESVKDIFSYEPNQENYHLFIYEKNQQFVWVDWDEMLGYSFKNGIGRYSFQHGFRISSQLNDNLSIYGDALVNNTQRKAGYLDYPSEYHGGLLENDYYFNDKSMGRYVFQYTTAYINYKTKVGTFELGMEPIIWGNSSNRSLILSNNVDPFAFVSWELSFKKAKFSYFHGSILPNKPEYRIPETGEVKYAQKYIVGHRLELIPSKRFHFGLTEMLIYGNKNPQLMYLLPTSLYWVSQQNVGLQDNISWIFDTEIFPVNGIKLYGTFYMDEFADFAIFKNSWHNMFGIQGGIQFAPRHLTPIPTDLRIEFTAVHPWVYTHRVPLYSSYTHDGRVLGFYAGPNSQLFFMENRWWISRRQRLSLSFGRLLHGEDTKNPGDEGYYPVGGDANQNYDERNNTYDLATKWLMGKIITSDVISFHYELKLTNVLNVLLGYQKVWNETISNDYLHLRLYINY